ncbi:MAG: hypothetical protein AB7Q42_14825 [Acidimicrobiia bacterium]
MRDVVFVSITLGFFAIAAGYVRACARIVGAEEISTGTAPAELEEVAP